MKKRIISVVLCMALLLTVFTSVPITASAASYDFEVDGVRYAQIDDNSVKIVGCNSSVLPEDLVIPETVQGKTVTEIGERTFFKTNIKSVILPETVTEIGPSAFSTILSLTSVTILGNITELSNGVFYYCPYLSEVNLPDSIKHIGDEAFGTCKLEKFQLPKNVETIGSYAFRGCGIKQLTIPASLHTIGNHGFDGLYNLTEVIFEERTTLLSLGDYAFTNCKRLTSFDFTCCDKLGSYAFNGCTGFTSITLPDNIDISSGYGAFFGCTNLKTVTLSENMTAIPSAFFSGCTKLESVQGSDITSIGSEAFYFCTSITEYNFPYCTYIGSEAFFNCQGLTNVVFPDNIDITLGYGVFSECAYLKTITLPRNMTEIPKEFFYNCQNLESIQGNKMTSVGSEAFTNCRKLTSFDFAYCTNIGSSAFANCKGLTNVIFPDNIDVTLGKSAFSGCINLKTVELADNTYTIPGSCFLNCSSLESIQGGKITSIGSNAFKNCSSLVNFDFSFCTSIGDSAFQDCAGLTSAILSDNNVTIGKSVFLGCTNLKTAKLSNNIDTIPDNCFRDCTRLESIQTGEIKTIGDSAFYNCSNLTDVSFAKDNSISTVKHKAFTNCSKLTEINLCNVTYIYGSTFENCYNLSKVTFGENLKDIGENAFYNCYYLAEVSLFNIGYVGKSAFENCYSLSSVTFKEGLKTIEERAFFNCFSLYEIYIPKTVELIGSMALGCFEEEGQYYIYTDFTVLGDPESLAPKYAEAYEMQYALPDVQLSSISNSADGIKITFEKLSGLSGQYRIYRKTADTSWSKLADVTTASYTDKTAVSGVYYTYTVKFIGYDGTESRYDKNGLSITRLVTPKVTKIQNTEKGAKLTIEKVEGAAYYRVYYKTSDGWKGIDNTDTTTFVHESAQSGQSYTYTVKAFDKFENSSSFNSNGWSNTFIATPQITSVTSTEKGVKITWDKIDGAVNYRVYYKNGSDWKGIGNTTSTTFTHTDATPGVKYTYTVRCMKSDGKTAVSDYSKQGKSHTYFYRGSMASMHKAMQKIKSNNSAVEPAQKSSSALKPQAAKSALVATVKQATQQLYSKLRGFAKR